MTETRRHPIAICCRDEAGFVRAHLRALQRQRTSILVPRGEWRRLPSLAASFGPFDVLTDDASHPELAAFRPEQADAALEPSLPSPADWPDPVALLLTSGTTGMPKPVAKNAKALLGEIRSLRAVLQIDPGACFVSTVPLEHMFGYTFGFWLPRLSGASTHPQRVVLPEDLRKLCDAARRPLWIITTPAHLRAYTALDIAFRNVAGVICATAPLSSSLARQAARGFGAALTEIYGSTETGAIAWRMRRADEAGEPWWTPLPGIDIGLDAGGRAHCRVAHLDHAVTLDDRLDLCDAGFKISGRGTDIVKVGGKRHSLAALDALLASVPGVIDGAYYFPDDDPDRAPARPAAFVVLQAGTPVSGVLDRMRELVDEVFLPRPVFQVDALPRAETGKLGRAALDALYQECRTRRRGKPC
jgi:acyl-coenzyme A synthetase/AMP-(fatty) acid ligase